MIFQFEKQTALQFIKKYSRIPNSGWLYYIIDFNQLSRTIFFQDGTTDVTRTMHFGTPKDFEKDCFTRVLKGQINLTQAVFPNKIKGIYLDSLARQFLWEVGLDYSHGTGHGVGHYLNVHEG